MASVILKYTHAVRTFGWKATLIKMYTVSVARPAGPSVINRNEDTGQRLPNTLYERTPVMCEGLHFGCDESVVPIT